MSVHKEIDDMLIKAIESINKDFDIDDFNISDDFNIKIKIEGEFWDGYIDYKIASYVDRLQKDVLNIYNRMFKENLSLRNKEEELKPVIVKVKIEEGCTEVILHIKDIVIGMVNKMDSTQTFIALITALVLAAGLYGAKSYWAHVEKLADKADTSEDKKAIKEIALAAIEQSKTSTTAITGLVSKMNNEDKITIAEATPMNKAEAKENYKYNEYLPIEKTYYIDDKFVVTNVDLENQCIRIKIKAKPIVSSIKIMNEEAKHKLSEMVEKGLTLEYAPEIDLQISAVFLDGIFKEAYCTNIGPKRPEAVSYFDVAGKKPRKSPGPDQASLPV